MTCDITDIDGQRTGGDRDIGPADDGVAPEQRQRIVAPATFRHRGIRLESIRPVPQHLEPSPVPDDLVEWRQQTNSVVRFGDTWLFAGRPIPVDAIDARMCEPLSRALQSTGEL